VKQSLFVLVTLASLLCACDTPVDTGDSSSVVPTDMGTLQAACPVLDENGILEYIAITDTGWWAGATHEQQMQWNAEGCGGDAECLSCWNAIVDYVYFVAH